MGLIEAYQAALSQDASLRAARAQFDSVAERLIQAQAQLRPNISFSASRFNNDLTRTQPNLLSQAATTDERYFSYSQTLQLRQPLYRPALGLAVDQAQAQIDDAAAVLEREIQNLGVKVIEAYAQILLAQEREVLLKVQYQMTAQQLDAAQKRFKAGQGIRTDADEAQARLDLLQAQQLEARQSRQTALLQLQALVQHPVQQVKPLALSTFHPSDFDAQSATVWMDKAQATSPEISALRARVEAARLDVERIKSNHKPTLDAIAQITRSGSENVTTPQSSYINRQLGLQFNLPLYSGGATQSAVRQALAEQTRLEAVLEATKRDLEVRIQKEWRGVTEGASRIKAQERVVNSADQVTIAVRRSFEGGVRTVLDVINAEQQAQQARRDLSENRLNYVVARLKLLNLVGELNATAFGWADRWFSERVN
jgi:outer membrane protein/protease secretion system outer membrane protein